MAIGVIIFAQLIAVHEDDIAPSLPSFQLALDYALSGRTKGKIVVKIK